MLPVVALMVSGWMTSFAQGIEPEVPGDHFSLEGALELFKKSASPEEFEKMLNSPDSKVNNLDLNGDGYIDYIRVFDRYEGNIHAFIIQAVVSDSENQDVAVIELEKLANGKAVLQIIGDEDIYGVETIIEPTREVRTYAGSMAAPTVVNVWAWPSVQYVYSPYYSGWYSPWGWHVRPVWWRSWRPVVYVHYYDYWRPYRPHYAVCHTHRVVYAHRIYRPYRTTSVIVHNRHHAQVTRYRSAYHDGRTRNDEARNSRSSTRGADRERGEVNSGGRRSSAQREAFSSDRSFSRERSPSRDIQRTTPGAEREDFRNSRSGTGYNTRDIRSQRTTGEDNSRSFGDNNVKQRSTIAQTRTNEFQRNTTGLNRNDLRDRSGSGESNREVRQQLTAPSRNSNGSFENHGAQRSNIREGSVINEVHRNSNALKKSDSPIRSSGTFRQTRQQVDRPASIERNRSSAGSVQPQRQSNRTGATRPGENKRGRH